MVIAPLGEDGKVSFFSQSGADLIADVAGWFTDDTALVVPPHAAATAVVLT
jgi:hypothetical protein